MLKLYGAVAATAKANRMTNSELFREAFRRYLRDEREWQDLLSPTDAPRPARRDSRARDPWSV